MSCTEMLLRLAIPVALCTLVGADPHTTGIYRATLDQQLLFDSIAGEINVFVPDEAVDSGILGFNGMIRGFPLLDGVRDEVHVVIHAGMSCEDPLAPIEHLRGNQFNFTFSIENNGLVLPFASEVYSFPETFEFRAVIVYLTNGAVVGCGQLNHIEDNEAIEVFANALHAQAGYQAEITGVVSPDFNMLCYFGTLVGLPPNLGSANCSSETVENQCSLHIRSQSTCEEDLNEALVPNTDAWKWSRYYWSNADGFSTVSSCVDTTLDLNTLVDGNSLLIYDPDGTAVSCGAVQPYETPSPSRETLKRSQVYCAYLDPRDDLQHFWGAMFIFQDTATIEHGVIGLAGHIYNDQVCTNVDCELLLSTSKTCDEEHTDLQRVGVLSTNSDGSMFGMWEVTTMDLEDTIALLRLPNGTIASCDFIKEVSDSTVYQIETLPYSGRSVVGEMTASNAYSDDLCSFGFAYGLEANLSDCGDACSYQVHTGTSCDDPGDALFNADSLTENPWRNSRYSSTDMNGVAVYGGCVNTKYSSFEYQDRTMVIRGLDNLPSSCGSIEPFQPLEFSGTCDLCPFESFEISAPDAFVNLGGPVNVTCQAIQESAVSALFSFDDCIRVKQEASKSCNCVPQGRTTNISAAPNRSRTIGFSVVAAVVATLMLLVLAWFFMRFRKGSIDSNKDVPFETPEEELMEREVERRSLQQSSDSTSALPSAIAVPLGQQTPPSPPPVATRVDHAPHGALSTKNQLRGHSFWTAEPDAAAPYADAVPVQAPGESSDAAPRHDQREDSLLSL